MSCEDLTNAALAARFLASTVPCIRDLPEGQARERVLKQLDCIFNACQEDIRKVEMELAQTRNRTVRLGDFVAPTAHELTIKMVYALNQERFNVIGLAGVERRQFQYEIIGRKEIVEWPSTEEVIAEIELEYAKAKGKP
jgi:hypothetical protein